MPYSEDIQIKRKKLRDNSSLMPILLCWLAYIVACIGKYNYPANVISFVKDFDLKNAEAGLVTTFFFFAYGIGQFVNGFACKRYNKRVIISVALLLSSTVNIIISLGVSFEYVKYLWLLNGVAQSVVWPVLISVLSDTLKAADLSKAVVIMTSALAIGTFIIYGLSAIFTAFNAYLLSFFIPAIIMSIVAVIWFIKYPKVFNKTIRLEETKKSTTCGNKRLSGTILFMFIIFALFAIVINFVKDGLTTWVPSILKSRFGLPDSLSIFLTLVLPVVSVFGSFLSTFTNRKIKSLAFLAGLWLLLMTVCIGFVIYFINSPYWFLALIFFGAISLFSSSTATIITGMAPLYLRDKIDTGFLSGTLNGFSCLGITISSYTVGLVSDVYGWNGIFILFFIITAVSVCLAIVASVCGKYNKKLYF